MRPIGRLTVAAAALLLPTAAVAQDAAMLRADHPNAVRIRAFEIAIGAGEPVNVEEMFAEDIIVHAGSGPVGGSTRGRDALLARIAETARLSDGTLSGVPLHVAANDDQAVVVFRVTARRGGRVLDTILLELWKLKDGRVVEIWDNFEDRVAWDRFWNE